MSVRLRAPQPPNFSTSISASTTPNQKEKQKQKMKKWKRLNIFFTSYPPRRWFHTNLLQTPLVLSLSGTHRMTFRTATYRMFLNNAFYREGLLAPRPTPKLEDYPSSAVRDCFFCLFVATHLIGGRPSILNLRTRHAVVTGTNYMGCVGSPHFFKGYVFGGGRPPHHAFVSCTPNSDWWQVTFSVVAVFPLSSVLKYFVSSFVEPTRYQECLIAVKSTVLCQKLVVVQLTKFPVFYCTRRFINAHYRACNMWLF